MGDAGSVVELLLHPSLRGHVHMLGQRLSDVQSLELSSMLSFDIDPRERKKGRRRRCRDPTRPFWSGVDVGTCLRRTSRSLHVCHLEMLTLLHTWSSNFSDSTPCNRDPYYLRCVSKCKSSENFAKTGKSSFMDCDQEDSFNLSFFLFLCHISCTPQKAQFDMSIVRRCYARSCCLRAGLPPERGP